MLQGALTLIIVLFKVGGRLVIAQSVANDKGHYEGEDTAVSRHHLLRDLWQGLVTDGLISQVRPLCECGVGGWLAVWLTDWLVRLLIAGRWIDLMRE